MAYTPTVYVNGVAPALNATNLNHAENGLQAAAAIADAALAAPTPVTNGPVYWTGSAWASAKLVDAQIAAAAGIAYSKLSLALAIVNGDISATAAIALSKLAGYPSDATKFARGDGTWAVPSGLTTYRKTTSKTVNTTTTATDLLNAEITLAALTATSCVRVTAWGDWLNNTGGAVAPPRIQAILGSTTLLDTNTGGSGGAAATRYPWRLTFEILNLGATNSQQSSLTFRAGLNVSAATTVAFTTGEGVYSTVSNGAFSILDAIGVNPSTAVDTSTTQALVLKVINGSASASCETKLTGALIEVL